MKYKLLAIIFLLLSTATPVFAKKQGNVCEDVGGSWKGTVCVIANPLGAGVSAQQAIGIVIKGLLGIVGVVALVFFVYGGFMWLTAAGDEKKYKAGWDIMTWATLGLVLIFGSTAIVSFILKITGVD